MKIKNIIYRLLTPLFPQYMQKIRVIDTANSYDMYAMENEAYYSRLYLYFITNRLKIIFGEKKVKILDIGCGQGRLAIPLAKKEHDVTAIDMSFDVIDSAKNYAVENHADIDFRVKDAINFLDENDLPFDCIICTEVSYMVKDYEKLVDLIHKNLKSDGILFLAFREKYYYMLHTIMHKRLNKTKLVCSEEKGALGLGGVELNWHTHGEMTELLSKNNFKDIEFNGIGICSGIEGDPLAHIVQPKFLSLEEQEILFEIETSLADEYSKCGRYVLASAIKS